MPELVDGQYQSISDTKSTSQLIPHTTHFVGSQSSETSLQFNGRNGLNLLQVKCTGFEERFRDVHTDCRVAQ